MRVGVYVPQVGAESGGGLTFMSDVLGALAAVPHTHEFHVLYSGPTPPEGSMGLQRMRVPDRASPMDSPLDVTASRVGLDVVWFLAPEHRPQPVTVPFVATVWDLEHRNHPYFPEVSVSGWTWDERERYYRSMLPRAACVVVGTAEGKRQIERFYGVPDSLIAIVPFPTPSFSPEELGEDPERLSDLGIHSPFLFYPAQFWPHKNHATLLHALKELIEQGQLVELVLAGSDKGNLDHVRAMTRELGLDDQVRFVGFVDRRTLVALYRNALALVFPSFFGPDNLPPLEAFALGCPVVAAALPGTAELYGDAAILLDPADEASWADAVRLLLRDPRRRIQLSERGLAHSGHWTPADYVRVIAARLDTLEPVRRCWSRSERYVHPGEATAQALDGQTAQIETMRASPAGVGGAQDMVGRTRADDMRVDFAQLTMPGWVRYISGLSAAETWGRWSDATLAPSARICSFFPLPRKTVLRLRLAVVKPTCSPVVVTVGTQSFEVAASIEPEDFVLEVDTDVPADTIDIRPSMSFSPKDQGWGEDTRRLGVALHTLEIVPRLESLPT